MNVLVIAAHPDDEALGCGGTLARYAAAGAAVHIAFMSDGESARDGAAQTAAGARRDAAEQAARILGAAGVSFHDFPDNRMDSVPLLEVVRTVEEHLRTRQPRTVLTHHGGDLNIDHAVTARAVLTACRPLPGAPVQEILAFEVPSSTEWAPAETIFRPQLYVDIEATLARKMEALQCYAAELRPAPHARSEAAVRALATHRGHSAGLPCAEAFMVMRSIRGGDGTA